jgi:hypothetical protein
MSIPKGNMLYEVALIEKPTKKEQEDGKTEKLILPPTPILAADDRQAGFKAIIEYKDKIQVDLQRVEVLVRPFA